MSVAIVAMVNHSAIHPEDLVYDDECGRVNEVYRIISILINRNEFFILIQPPIHFSQQIMNKQMENLYGKQIFKHTY